MEARGWVAALLSIGLSTGLAHAQAAKPSVELRWYAPAECPDNLGVLRAIETYLGQPIAEAPQQQLSIVARVVGDAAHGYAAKLTFLDAEGATERVLEHTDCGKLTEGVALLAALAIDPERVQAKQQATAASAPDAAPPASAPATPTPIEPEAARGPARERGSPAAPESEQRATGLQVRVGLLGLVGGGMLPSTAPGLSAEVSLGVGMLEAALGGRYWLPSSAAVPGPSGSAVALSLVSAGLRLCGVPGRKPWSLLVCGRADLGDMAGRGQGVDNSRARHARVTGFGGTVALGYTAGRLRPLAGADLVWLASSPDFGVLQEGRPIQAFQPQTWQVTTFLGLSYQL